MAKRQDSVNLTNSQINSNNDFFDLKCTRCSKKNRNKKALKYCVNCKEYFCVTCVENHDSFQELSGHSLLDPQISTSPPSRTGGRKFYAIPTELCQHHPMEVVSMYCGDEDIVGCSVCFTFNHRSCDDIHYIPDYVQSHSPAEQVDRINNDLTDAIEAMNKLKTQHDDNLDTSIATCKQEIQKYRKEINQIIDKIESTTLVELDARHKYMKKNTHDTNSNIYDLNDEMLRFKSEIESDLINDPQKFVIAKLSHCVIQQGQELLSKLSSDQTTELTFTRNSDIITFLLSVDTLGMLSPSLPPDSSLPVVMTSCKTKPTSSSASTESSNKTRVCTKQDASSSVSNKSEYSIEQPNAMSVCGILSSCILDSGNILSTKSLTSALASTDNSNNTTFFAEQETGSKLLTKQQNQGLNNVSDKSQRVNTLIKQPNAMSGCGISSSSMLDNSTTLSTKSLTSASASTGNRNNTTPFKQQETGRKVFRKRYHGLYKVSNKSEYTIKQPDDKSVCSISSSCILKHGNILLADCNNSNLKLVDGRRYTVRSSLALNGRPWSVCRFSSTEAAVSLYNSTIQFVSTRSDELVPVRSIRIKHHDSGKFIAVIRDKMYVGCAQSVDIYTLNGKLVQTIRKDKAGTDIFSLVWNITVSYDEEMIHVADWNKGVITLNTDGDVVWRYSGTALGRAYGICTDEYGDVIVSGAVSNTVIQLGPRGQFKGHINSHSDGVISPHTVCYDIYSHTLIIGRANSNNITVLTLK